MAKDKKKPGGDGPRPQAPAVPQSCAVGECGEKVRRLSFCNDHFAWFKEGLVNKRGEKPKDFDKKYQAYMRKKAQVA